jgi:hypothetical protein
MDPDEAYPPATKEVPPISHEMCEEWDEEKVTPEIELAHYLYFLSLSNEIGGLEEVPPQAANES